jgi:hypothetical protein
VLTPVPPAAGTPASPELLGKVGLGLQPLLFCPTSMGTSDAGLKECPEPSFLVSPLVCR